MVFKAWFLRGCADMRFACQAGEELGDFLLTHFSRMAFVVIKDESLDPAHIRFLSPWAVVPRADRFADLVEQPGLWCVRRKSGTDGGLHAPICHVGSVVPETSHVGMHGDLLFSH